MEIWAVLSLSLATVLILCGLFVWVTKHQAKEREQISLREQTKAELQAKILDKTIALLASRDALTYQSVQFMNGVSYDATEPYDPSDEAEIRRIEERNRPVGDEEGELNGSERSIADALSSEGIPGFDF